MDTFCRCSRDYWRAICLCARHSKSNFGQVMFYASFLPYALFAEQRKLVENEKTKKCYSCRHFGVMWRFYCVWMKWKTKRATVEEGFSFRKFQFATIRGNQQKWRVDDDFVVCVTRPLGKNKCTYKQETRNAQLSSKKRGLSDTTANNNNNNSGFFLAKTLAEKENHTVATTTTTRLL